MEKTAPKKENRIETGERLDEIGFGNLRLLQKPEDFCYGIDAVLLADFAARGLGRYGRVRAERSRSGGAARLCGCDLGTGTGVVPLILHHKLAGAARLVGVEVQADSAARAARSVALNGLDKTIAVLTGDVSDGTLPARAADCLEMLLSQNADDPTGSQNAGCPADSHIGDCSETLDRGNGSGVLHGADGPEAIAVRAGDCPSVRRVVRQFDFVTMNPPYVEGGCGLCGRNPAKQIARQETTGTLADFIRTAARLLRKKGELYVIHRPARLADLFCLFREHGIEPKTLRFVSPREGDAPNLVLLHGVLGGGRALTVQKPLAVYDADGSYTREIYEIYER